MAIDALAKGLEVLACFSAAAPEWGVTQLSAGLRMPKSRVHRILQTLSAAQFVVQDPNTLRYRLGSRLQSFSAGADAHAQLKAVARPFLIALQEQTRGGIHIRVARGEANVIIEAIDSPLPLRLVRPLGETNPIYFGASGKALLAFSAPSVRERLLSGTVVLQRFTDRSIKSRAEFLRELARVRRAGYAYTDEEAIAGVRSVAAPVLDADGHPIAAITSALPAAALPDKAVAAHGRAVVKCARLVSEALRRAKEPANNRNKR